VKIRPLGAELFYADGQTDVKLAVIFRNFAKAPENRQTDVQKNTANIRLALGYYA
jgi:hypothetical protein